MGILFTRKFCMLAVLTALSAAPARADHATAIPEETQAPDFLCEVIRHLYRWYLDEHDIEKIAPDAGIAIRLRNITPPDLDPGDRSRIIEMELPALALHVTLKKTDYRIPELNLEVKSKTFKIIDVARDKHGAPAPGDALEIKLPVQQIKNFVFRTRSQRDPLTPALGRHVHDAIRREIADEDASLTNDMHEAHIAPLSPVANELWIFWETGRRLIRVTSDLEIADPAMWQHEHLAVRLYDIDRQTVVSLEETPGSNAYLTRDQVGRALFNCMVLGEYREINIGLSAAPAPPGGGGPGNGSAAETIRQTN